MATGTTPFTQRPDERDLFTYCLTIPKELFACPEFYDVRNLIEQVTVKK